MTDHPAELAEVREHIKEAKDAAEQAEKSGIVDSTPDKPADEGDAEEAADTD